MIRLFNLFKAELKKYLIEVRTYYPDHIVNVVVLIIFFVGFLNSNIGSGNFNSVYIGFVFWFFASNVISESANSISFEKQSGTFEQLMSKPVNIQIVIIFRVIAWLLMTSVKVGFVLVFIRFAFNIPFILTFGVVLILLLTLVGILGVGLFLSGLTIKYTKTASFESIINYFLLFFSGTFGRFNPSNKILKMIQENIPLSRGISLAAKSLEGSAQAQDVLLLGVNSAVYFLIGLITFEVILSQGKKKGICSNY
jgi:ABC-2 type transport system permease protein